LADSPNILVLGVGNLLRRDEGFGIHVVRLLSERYREGPGVSIVDGGTAGSSLLGTILECDHLILVDVALMREEPGAICRLEGSTLNCVFKAKQSAHDWSFSEILLEALMLGHAPTVAVIAAEPEDIDHWSPELSPTLSSRVPDAVARVVAEVAALGGMLVPNNTEDTAGS
jgi:hydrogenase maturation protease